jgi:gamma-glutamylaminecyclotransferase
MVRPAPNPYDIGREMASSLLFVYGTLKRGQRSNHLLAGQQFVSEATTRPLYRLFDRGPYPYLVHDPEHGVVVRGEIWEVDAQTLQRLDEWEGVPEEYQRQPIALDWVAGPVEAYFFRGDVSSYKDCGAVWPAP